jgi:DNA-binding transcriptional LysR family regulator
VNPNPSDDGAKETELRIPVMGTVADVSRSGGDIELRHLRYFVAVAEERHFGRAAQRLGIAQPGVSQQIIVLERRVGVALFFRDRQGVELTPAGNVLLEHAHHLLELADHAIEHTRLTSSGKSGMIRVGIPATGVHEPAKTILEAFAARSPQVEVQLHPGLVRENVAGLEKHTLDAAFVLAPFDSHHRLHYQPLHETELLIALPDGHRLALLERIPREELLQETFLDWPLNTNPPLVRYLRRLVFGEGGHPDLQEVLDVGETTRLLLVAAGKGVTLARPPDEGQLSIPGVTLRRLEEPAPWVQCGIAWPEGHTSPVTEAFLGVAREFAPPPPLHTAGLQAAQSEQESLD